MAFFNFGDKSPDGDIRKEQNQFHHEQTTREVHRKRKIIVNNTNKPKKNFGTKTNPPKQFAPRGHDRALNALQLSKSKAIIVVMNQSDPIVGTIIARDRYTITIETSETSLITILFKSALVSISYERPRKTEGD